VRATLDIDEDVLESAKELAAKRGTTAGRVLSEHARSALAPGSHSRRKRNGLPILPKRRGGRIVTQEIVNRLRDEDQAFRQIVIALLDVMTASTGLRRA
jgi:hypothetical protein